MKYRFLSLILIILFFVFDLSSAEKWAITFEDFFSMKRMGGLTVSPDGHWAAYTIQTPDIEENNITGQIRVLDLKTNQSRQLTNDEKSSSGPVWHPDSKTIYFTRGGQIWRQTVDEEQAEKLTDFYPGAGGIVISRDGSKMLFSSQVYPECETIECNEQKMKAQEENKVKARVIDNLMYRHWNQWLEGKVNHVFMAGTDGSGIVDLTPGPYHAPPVGLGSGHDYTFSPDGKEVCYVTNTDEIIAAGTNNDLFIKALPDGKAVRLTQNEGNDNGPHYSPDGKYIAYLSMERAGFEADRYRIMLYDRKKKSARELTKGFELSASSIVWHPAGKEIYFSAAERDFINIYKVNINTSKIEPVLEGHYIHDLNFINENEILFAKETASTPREIYKYDLKTDKLTRISRINTELLAQLEMPAYEDFWFEGANGDSVHGLILKPPFFDPDKKYPAIELIHGGPQGAWGNDFHYRWNYQMFASPGYVIFMINFHGSRGYGQDFTDAVSKDWGGAPYEDILIGTKYVLDNYSFIDKERIGAAGASYGGFMINWIAGAENPFQCLVSHDGVYEQVSMYGATEELWFPEWEFNGKPWQEGSLYRKWNPANRAEHFETPMLVIHGEHDYRVPYTQGLQLFTALQRQGVKSRLLFFPDEDHFVRKPQNARLWWKTVHEWFAEFLMNE